jgi:hypothetical protein
MTMSVCRICKQVYNTSDCTLDQKIIADEDFCPACWRRMFEEIGTVSD